MKYVKIFSIDIALGAVVGAWFFAQVVHINLQWFIYLIIALAVWSIYTIDHILDARKLKGKSGPARYSYHLKYYYPAIAFIILAVIAALFLSFFLLPEALLIYGFYLCGIVVLYFILRLLLKPVFAGLKELMAAIVYTAGIALPALYYMNEFSFFFLSVVLQFFCLVFANLLICALWDENWDKIHSSDSMAITFGKKFITAIIFCLISITALSSLTGILIYEGGYINIQLVILLMDLVLLTVYLVGPKFTEHTQRLMIDSIFFIPLILLFL